MGLELSNSYWNYGRTYSSLSHTVGSEHPSDFLRDDVINVTIPHGGLRTDALGDLELPSVDVTIPHGGLRTVKPQLLLPYASISHHPTRWAQNYALNDTQVYVDMVTIPHGGLGTKMWYSNTINHLRVTIPHGGLGTSNDHIKQNKTYQ